MNLIKAIISEFKTIKSGRKELREFGLTIGIILVILGGLLLWRHRPAYPYFLTVGGLFIAFGLILPKALKPLQIAWMALGLVLGFFVSRIILMILFYAVITPIGLLTRLLGKDILDERIDKSKTSYWHRRQDGKKEKSSYENQY